MVSSSMVKTIGLTLGYTRQWRRSSCRYLDEGIVWSLLGLDLTSVVGSGDGGAYALFSSRRHHFWRIFIVVIMLSRDGWCGWSLVYVINRCFHCLWEFFFFLCLRLCIASVFNDFAIGRRGTLCACVSVGCVHLRYAKAGCTHYNCIPRCYICVNKEHSLLEKKK